MARKTIKKTVCFFLFLMLAGMTLRSFPVFAEEIDVREQIKSCAPIESMADRLICYDTIVQKLQILSSEDFLERESKLREDGFWEASKKRSPSGHDIVYLKNKTSTTALSSSGGRYNPVLTIICQHADTDVYIDWQRSIKVPPKQGVFSFSLQYQLDSGDRKDDNWELSTDRRALFSPDPVSLIKEMRQHKKLVLFIAVPGEPSETLVYDLSGINDMLGLLVKECYNN